MSKARIPEHQRGAITYGQGFAIELVRQLVVPAFVLDAACRVIVWNQACERLTGIAAADIIGTRDHWRAFYREPRPCLADLVLQNRLTEIDRFYVDHHEQSHDSQDFHAENWCVMPVRGTELYLALDAGPIRDDTGRVVAAVETLRDMTEHKRAEEALRLTASVFENSQEGIVITDTSARILVVNKAFTQVTGYAADEVRGRSPAVLKSGLHDSAFYHDMWERLGRTGRWQGEVWNRRKSGDVYPQILHINAVKDAEACVSHYVGMFIDITDLRDTEQRLEAMANFDPLTHLPNRVLLAERLREAMLRANRLRRLVAICSLDLDDFKCINDREGHEIGDSFLIEVAHRLTGTLGAGDTVARLGGDEFALLITDLEEAAELEAILDRVLAAVSSPFLAGRRHVAVSVSMGVTLYPLDDGDPDTLLRHSSQSMYQAKQLGRNRYHLFDRQAANELQNRHRDIERIRQGLQHGELRLFYQPKVNMRSGEVIGVEALLRWQHPEQGLLSPAAFLPLAETSPLMIGIGEWVLHEALSQIECWANQGAAISVGVNLAARHFQDPQFVTRLESILADHPCVPPRQLELEILESAALEDIDTMRQVILACQAMGVSFALDDFGTGYSSLSYLKQLPVDTLKIDRSFVRDMLEDRENLAIIEGVVGLANVFGKTVVAEGVETMEHGRLLMRFGCDRGQGFGIGYPMPADEVLEWVRAFKPDWTWNLVATEPGRQLDVPLLLAQYDHLELIQGVIDALDRGGPAPSPGELADSRACRFGLWYWGEGAEKYGDLPSYGSIDGIHRGIHETVRQILRLRDAGDLDAARSLCATLNQEKDEMLERLNELQQEATGVSNAGMADAPISTAEAHEE